MGEDPLEREFKIRRKLLKLYGFAGADAEDRLNAEIARRGWPRLNLALRNLRRHIAEGKVKSPPAMFKLILQDLEENVIDGIAQLAETTGGKYDDLGGATVRDTSETFAAYRERMIRERLAPLRRKRLAVAGMAR